VSYPAPKRAVAEAPKRAVAEIEQRLLTTAKLGAK
jgi:hypothetical protein